MPLDPRSTTVEVQRRCSDVRRFLADGVSIYTLTLIAVMVTPAASTRFAAGCSGLSNSIASSIGSTAAEFNTVKRALLSAHFAGEAMAALLDQ